VTFDEENQADVNGIQWNRTKAALNGPGKRFKIIFRENTRFEGGKASVKW
jgi:hypothetical protein